MLQVTNRYSHLLKLQENILIFIYGGFEDRIYGSISFGDSLTIYIDYFIEISSVEFIKKDKITY